MEFLNLDIGIGIFLFWCWITSIFVFESYISMFEIDFFLNRQWWTFIGCVCVGLLFVVGIYVHALLNNITF